MTKKQLLKKLSETRISANGARKLWCGEKIGYGVSREVFVLKFDPRYVVKISTANDFANVAEWMVWGAYKFAPWYKKWFAPCIGMNDVGTVLVQRRVRFPDNAKYPKNIPTFFSDIKKENFGFIGNQPTCCDYASVIGRMTGLMTKKMRAVRKWK